MKTLKNGWGLETILSLFEPFLMTHRIQALMSTPWRPCQRELEGNKIESLISGKCFPCCTPKRRKVGTAHLWGCQSRPGTRRNRARPKTPHWFQNIRSWLSELVRFTVGKFRWLWNIPSSSSELVGLTWSTYWKSFPSHWYLSLLHPVSLTEFSVNFFYSVSPSQGLWIWQQVSNTGCCRCVHI